MREREQQNYPGRITLRQWLHLGGNTGRGALRAPRPTNLLRRASRAMPRLPRTAVFLPPVDSPRCRTVAGPGGAIGAASRRLQLRTVNGTATTLSLRAAAGIPRSSMANGRLRGAAGPVREPWWPAVCQ